MSKTNRHPARFDHVTGRFEYTEAQAREMAAADKRAHDAIIARNAAAAGLSVADFVSGAHLFAAFE
jgi:hypothetical protein